MYVVYMHVYTRHTQMEGEYKDLNEYVCVCVCVYIYLRRTNIYLKVKRESKETRNTVSKEVSKETPNYVPLFLLAVLHQ